MIRNIFLICLLAILNLNLARASEGKWIGIELKKSDTTNIWVGFRKEFQVKELPPKLVINIAVDTKYWLYINGEMVLFEGGLKRGPNPKDTYIDRVDISKYLKKGKNSIAVKVWYFGKNGFSHHSSGQLGLFISENDPSIEVSTGAQWKAKRLLEYQTSADPVPNFRLAESNILYDARIGDESWITSKASIPGLQSVLIYGDEGVAPWNNLIPRPIPQWKDFGLKTIQKSQISYAGDTLKVKMPYNMQFTPYLKIESKGGKLIQILTDNNTTYNGSTNNVRAAYLTKDGIQEYESLGWINGHELYFIIPKDVKVHELKYRETGYDTEFSGSFNSSDSFMNSLWEKARRTLYITMRDNYMDCPDRERAQWTGDAVLEAEEAFYALSPSSNLLTRKWLKELIDWQKPNGSLFSPIPAGNWDKELPDQILASIGYYGIWMYYQHTGDRSLLEETYPQIQRYLALWQQEENGLVKFRKGDWTWGDWGDNKDMLLLYNLWYYLAIKGNYETAKVLGIEDDADRYLTYMNRFKEAFNTTFWNGVCYRDPAYQGRTDDRVQALAVLAGVADESKYGTIEQVFKTERNASPYMEKYVYEAMFKMGLPDEANQRHRERFSQMVNNKYFTTLFEGWGIGKDGYGGGTVNHAWSGGGLTIMSAYMCGIKPLKAGYESISLYPQVGSVQFAQANVHSIKGMISLGFHQDNSQVKLTITVPVDAVLKLPLTNYKKVIINGQESRIPIKDHQLKLSKGSWDIVVIK